jgi:hypothetical protein
LWQNLTSRLKCPFYYLFSHWLGLGSSPNPLSLGLMITIVVTCLYNCMMPQPRSQSEHICVGCSVLLFVLVVHCFWLTSPNGPAEYTPKWHDAT